MELEKDPKERFSATADAYQRYRPSYPGALATWIAEITQVTPGGRVVDLGCGTGISSRWLASHGYRVVGVDPNADMLAQARSAAGGPTYAQGEAQSTGLPGAAFELATAGQAFHWFDLEPTLAELSRLLVPLGWACAFWNLRTPSPFNDDYERLLYAHSREYSKMADSLDPTRRLLDRCRGAVPVELRNDERLPWDGVLGRARSASYVVHSVADLPAFERLLREAFERHAAPDGTVLWAMRTVAVAWPRP